jgi:NADPH2:quinone reductase
MQLTASKQHLAIVIAAAGGPEVLRSVRVDMPNPGPGEVLIRVQAAGVNRHDCNQRRAGPGRARTDIPGLEVAGTVVEVGEGVPVSWMDKAVCSLVDGGGYAEFALAPLSLVFPVPAGLNFVSAAGLPEALFTTWFNIFELGRLQRGETVLIHGGTSGVGSLAIQALKALGYRVFATCGSEDKRQAACQFGADGAFNYSSPGLARDILTALQGRNVDVILDMSAGAHIDADLEILVPGGRIIHLSGGGGKSIALPLSKLMAKQGWITGSLLRPTPLAQKERIAERLRSEIWPKLGTAVLPKIAKTFPLNLASAAHMEMELGQHIGKIILTNS